MANYWAITIGINQYRYSQPLMHAQDDALSIHWFLTRSAGVMSSHCVLLSDLTTSVTDRAVYPDKLSITEQVQTITQQVGTDDVLWFFFSGYGIQLGHTDYLLPIDGNPTNIKETGIAIADLINSLAQLPTNKILLVLDISRSQRALSGQTIGAESIELAQKNQISLLLSCRPGQLSHETIDLRQGLFTTALLEALEKKYSTAAALSDYISKRLPELCDHYWRPVQNSVSVIHSAQRDTIVVPRVQKPLTGVISLPNDSSSFDSSSLGSSATEPAAATAVSQSVEEDEPGSSERVSSRKAIALGDHHSHLWPEGSNYLESSDYLAGSSNSEHIENTSATASKIARDFEEKLHNREIKKGSKSTVDPDHSTTATVPHSPRNSAETAHGTKLRNRGLLALAILLVGSVLFGQPTVQKSLQGLVNKTKALAERETDSGSKPAEELANAQLEASTTETPDLDTPDLDMPESSDSAAPSSNSLSASKNDSDDNSSKSATTAALIARANASLQQAQYSEALITLQQVPETQRDSAFADVLTKARGSAAAAQVNASMLTDARASIQPIQASKFAEAITKARLIQPGELSYEEAQQDIRSWSQVILDIAEGRATSGNLEGAIAAANVMPYDNAEFYQSAKARIAFWQQRQNSRAIIAAARAIPRSGQASSYQKGIIKLREVSIEHPEYETAQRLADEWSQRIFSIAQARAAQGRVREAVQAAVLVPAGTAAYEPAQQTVKRWQAQ